MAPAAGLKCLGVTNLPLAEGGLPQQNCWSSPKMMEESRLG